MTNNVVELFPKPTPVAEFLNLGHTFHRQIDRLLAQNTLPIQRAVVDAGHVRSQHELIHTLKRNGVQLVLDTKAAELATPGGASSVCTSLPWARESGIWEPDALQNARRLAEYCRQIAEFAVECGADVVLAPCHLIQSVDDPWLSLDLDACRELRVALDAAGGSSIHIDYLLIGSMSLLQRDGIREMIRTELPNLPIDNLWIRVSGFGCNGSCAAVRKYVALAHELGESGTPIVAERVSGIAGLALGAFGRVGGLSHGIANNREQFDSYPLRRPRKSGGGGTHRWVYVPTIDQYLKPDAFRKLTKLQGAKSWLVCTDESCCQGRAENMRTDYVRHSIIQRARQLKLLNEVPEESRAEALMRDVIVPTGRACRRLADVGGLAEEAPKIHKRLKDQSKRMDDLHKTTAELIHIHGRNYRLQAPKLHFSQIIPAVSGY